MEVYSGPILPEKYHPMIISSLQEFHHSPQQLQDELQNPYMHYYIEPHYGYISGQLLYRELEIIRVYIIPNQRNKGYGTQLLTTLLHDYHFDRVFLEVRSQHGIARRLYQNAGFSEIATRVGYYHHPTDDAIIMERKEDLIGHH